MLLAPDLASGNLILYGGRDNNGQPVTDTWAWNGSAWNQIASPLESVDLVPVGPGNRLDVGMVAERSTQSIFLSGGTERTCDAWRLSDGQWRKLLDIPTPPPRVLFAIAYDSARRQTVIFGGGGNQSARNDTWLRRGDTWVEAAVPNAPARRQAPAMAFDPQRGRAVLFGGNDDLVQPFDDTWEWDGVTWQSVSLPVRPSSRLGAAMSTNPGGGVVLFGGSGTVSYLGDTWVYDGASWREIATFNGPRPRDHAAMAFDSHRNRVVLFGGRTPTGRQFDTWEWDGARWTQRLLVGQPPPRDAAAMTYDGARRVVVLHGGRNEDWTQRSDTWEFDGVRWRQRFPSTGSPARSEHAMVYLEHERRVLMFGGRRPNSAGNNWWRENSTWFYVPEQAADYAPYGMGCSGSAGTPMLSLADTSELPWLGSTIELRVGSLLPGQLGAMFLGTSSSAWGTVRLPFDLTGFGMTGCSLLASPDHPFPIVANAAGVASWSTTLCACASLNGHHFYNQTLMLDPAANPRGLVLSNAGAGTFGTK
jgi:hypothetical protein